MAATMIASKSAIAGVSARSATVQKQSTVTAARLQKLGKSDVAAEWAQKTVSNGMRVRQMMVWQPEDNKYFETLSYLPPLTNDEISRQIDYVTRNGWTPCLEFANSDKAYVGNENTIRFGATASGYQDNRYWTMYKLPMFGCTDSSQVLKEIASCQKAFPEAFVRLVAFDAKRQVQVAGFLVSRPDNTKDYRQPSERSVATT